jgi:integrase
MIWEEFPGKTFTAKFQYKNKQYKKEGFKTKSEAEAWESEKRRELKNPPAPEPIRLTFSQASNQYVEDCKARYQKNTWRQKAFVYRNFLSFLNDDPLIESIPKQKFTEYLKYRKDKDGNCAANRDLKEFNALYNWGIRQELLSNNPCRNIQKYPEEPEERYVPPAEDIMKVRSAADSEDSDLIMTIYHTAGWTSEVLKLTWEDVDFEKRCVRLWTRKRRGGELQEDKLPMTDALYTVLKRRWDNKGQNTQYVFHNADGRSYTYHQKKSTMDKLCRKAGVKRFGFHAIRHHVASAVADTGKASLAQIQKLLRHKRVSTTDNYIKTLDPELRQVSNILDELMRFGGK